jgi:hypothetical protein
LNFSRRAGLGDLNPGIADGRRICGAS